MSNEGGFERGASAEIKQLYTERAINLKRKDAENELQNEAVDIEKNDHRISKKKKLEKINSIIKKRVREKGDAARYDIDNDENILRDDTFLIRAKKTDKFLNPDKLQKNREQRKREGLVAADAKTTLTPQEEEEASKHLPFLPATTSKYANRMYATDLYSGMVVLGAFEMVTDTFIIVSLPFGIRGFIQFNEVSEEFSIWSKSIMSDSKRTTFQKTDTILQRIKGMFVVGQLIKVAITGISSLTKKGLLCTLRPEIINRKSTIENYVEEMSIYGSVQSIQDRGYIISFGKDMEFKGFLKFADTKFFLPNSNVAAGDYETTLCVGQPIECYIQAIHPETKLYDVSVSHFLLSKTVAKDSSVISMDSIKAGMLVDTTIVTVYTNGINVRFLDFFSGDIHVLHLDKPLTEFSPNRMLRARILAVDHEKKRIYLSALSHCLGLRPFLFGPLKVGQVFEKGVIVKHTSPDEVILSLPLETKVKAFLHKSEVEEKLKKDTMKAHFSVDKALALPSRIKHIDYVDGMATLTTKAKELKKPIYSYYDIIPGQKLDGTVKIVRDDSLEIKFTDSIFGVVPIHSMAETLIMKPRDRFNVGQIVRCRVLKCVPDKKRLVLTLKPSLLQSSLPVMHEKDTCVVGQIAHGFISKLDESKLFVTFYGDVHGVVKRENCTRQPIQLLSDHFRIGQVVTTKTLHVNPKGLNLTLVFDSEDFDQIKQEDSIGLLLEGTSTTTTTTTNNNNTTKKSTKQTTPKVKKEKQDNNIDINNNVEFNDINTKPTKQTKSKTTTNTTNNNNNNNIIDSMMKQMASVNPNLMSKLLGTTKN